jgi:hypothetical protein
MSQHDVAYFHEQGQNLVVIMVHASDVQAKGPETVWRAMQLHARNAGLVGKTAICWKSGSNIRYYGPQALTRFLSRVPYFRIPWNRKLTIQ